MTEKKFARFTPYTDGKFSFLLISMLLLFVLYPLAREIFEVRGFILDIFFSVILLSTVYAVIYKKKYFVIAISLGLPFLFTRWSTYFVETPFLFLLSSALGVLFFAFTAGTILAYVLKQDKVTRDIIYGAVCVYLMIGLTWAFVFSLLEGLQPGSFSLEQVQAGTLESGPDRVFFPFIYYSFVTLTTLGYGDITPLTPPAQTFSFLEAIIGQIYLVVLVARLVGLHITQSVKNKQG